MSCVYAGIQPYCVHSKCKVKFLEINLLDLKKTNSDLLRGSCVSCVRITDQQLKDKPP